MTLSQGADFISRLELPFAIKYALGSSHTADLGDWIVEHRQEVIAALVEVGVLESRPWFSEAPHEAYRVVASHRHVWRADSARVSAMMSTLFVRCGCGEEREVPNRLPIEVPS